MRLYTQTVISNTNKAEWPASFYRGLDAVWFVFIVSPTFLIIFYICFKREHLESITIELTPGHGTKKCQQDKQDKLEVSQTDRAPEEESKVVPAVQV